MIVAYQKGLGETAKKLNEHGYNTVEWTKASTADAFLYTHSDEGLYSKNYHASQEGMLLVNANGKTLDEILSILKYRVYSPLF